MLDDAKKFIARVIALPEDGERAFIGVHYSFLPKNHVKGTKLPFSSKIASDPDGVVGHVMSLMTRNSNKDIYVCMGTQKEHGEADKFGGYKANKHADNIDRSKSLYIDTDFKGGDHGYKNQTESEKAFTKFLSDSGIPEPSLTNHSGGGFHHFWVFTSPLKRAEWETLARQLAEATRHHGFKCDVGVTSDISRILRVPNTLNHKYKPAKSVKIHKWTDRDYTPDEITAVLSKYVGGVTTSKVSINSTIDVSALIGTKPFVAFQSTDEMTELGAGISLSPPIDINEARKECLFIDDALNTGGANLAGQPAWNMATLLATFTTQGVQAAHDMAKSNQYYNAADQDKMYARKEADRQRSVGWPKCTSVYASGSAVCAGCQHFPKGKYPFSFINQVVTPAVIAPQTTVMLPTVGADNIPDAYRRDSKTGLVYRMDTDDDGNNEPVFPSDNAVMLNGALSLKPVFTLHFNLSVAAHVEPYDISLPYKYISNGTVSPEMGGILNDAGVVFNKKEMTRFLMAWVDKLRLSASTFSAYDPFGWIQNNQNKIVGFSYGGHVYCNGKEEPAGVGDTKLIKQYSPMGSLDKWREAATLVTDTKRPSMDAILASAFAAPLVMFTGEQGTYLSVFSEASGVGKTTAMRLAASVFGNPNTSMQRLQDTSNSVQEKMGVLRHLPIIWDELKGKDNLDQMARMIFDNYSGRGKSRLDTKIRQREVLTWTTMLVTASNDSMADYLDGLTGNNEAGVYRLFELEAKPTDTGKVTPAVATVLRELINENYGVAGLAYSKYIGVNHEMLRKKVHEFMSKFEAELHIVQAERFWLVTTVCLYLGARIANDMLGLTNIDCAALKDAMFDQILKMRGGMVETPRVVSDTITVTLLEYIRQHDRQIMRANDIWDRPGPCPAGAIMLEWPDKVEFIDGPVGQFGRRRRVLRLAAKPLYDWLDDKKVARSSFMRAMKFKLGAINHKKSIGNGIPGAYAGQQPVFDIDCSTQPELNEWFPDIAPAIAPSNVIVLPVKGNP